jgi:hypothetical protein
LQLLQLHLQLITSSFRTLGNLFSVLAVTIKNCFGKALEVLQADLALL